jgi:3D (Asp-Asp-Asp) domain-containing protein
MSNIKIRDLQIASSIEIKPGNFLVCALDENSGLPKLTRKLTLEQAISGGLQSSSISIPPSSLPIATTNDLGVIKVGSNLDINAQGVLSVNSTGINAGLPIATTNDLGVIKVGSNLDINAQGVLSVNSTGINAGLPIATTNDLGVIKVGSNLDINAQGVLSVNSTGINAGLPIATTNDLGVIKVGSNLDINAQGVLSVDNSAVNATHTGDATGSTSLTLATVNSNVGSFTNADITVNAKGLITAVASGSGSIQAKCSFGSNGILKGGGNVNVSTVVQISTGTYRVTFASAVNNPIVQATIADNSDIHSSGIIRESKIVVSDLSTTSCIIRTGRGSYTEVDCPVHLLVF